MDRKIRDCEERGRNQRAQTIGQRWPTKQYPKSKNVDGSDVKKRTTVNAPVLAGQVIIENVLDSRIDIVATKTMKTRKHWRGPSTT